MNVKEIKEKLFRADKKDYGDLYRVHYFEQYKMYYDGIEKNSDKRFTINSFFLGINTFVFGAIGYLFDKDKIWTDISTYIVAVFGIFISYIWYRMIRSYKELNSTKFKVLNVIEENLPLSANDVEWEALERGKNPKIYLPFSKIELWIPRICIAFYCVIFLFRYF